MSNVLFFTHSKLLVCEFLGMNRTAVSVLGKTPPSLSSKHYLQVILAIHINLITLSYLDIFPNKIGSHLNNLKFLEKYFI